MIQTITSWEEFKQRAYTPYSKTQECCLVLDENGNIHPGVRVENAAFPDTITSYQSAVYGCLASGNRPKELWVQFEEQSNDWQAIYLSEVYALPIIVKQELNVALFNPFTHIDKVSISHLIENLPYAQTDNSDFKVSALVNTEFGYLSGVNIENTDWRLGLCAERCAISRAKSYGIKQIQSLYVFAPKAEYCSPCGACRQVMIEHIPDEKVYLYHGDHTHSEIIMKYLLPHSFMSSNLKKDS